MSQKKSFDLTISPKYVANWTVWDALRELMQNAIDRETENSKAIGTVKYYDSKQRLIIGNDHTSLERRTLLLGETTKANNPEAIGQYGEGYKLAILILLRNGITVKIRTGDEVWIPAIKYSSEYDADILVIDVKQMKFSEKLIFELNNVEKKHFDDMHKRCLNLSQPEEIIKSDYGMVLKDEKYKGKLFVEGLFVCDMAGSEKIRFGYNMKAAHIQLDRDRNKVDSFNLFWEVGRIYASLDATYASLVKSLMDEQYRDIAYYDTHANNKKNPLYQSICTMNYNDFFEKHGKKAIPVRTQSEANFVKEKYNDLVPIVVVQKVYEYITNSASYAVSTKTKVKTRATPYSICNDFMKKNKKIFSKAMEKEFKENILERSREWMTR